MTTSRATTLFMCFALGLALVLASAPLWADEDRPKVRIDIDKSINNTNTNINANTNTNTNTNTMRDFVSTSNATGTGESNAEITFARQAPTIFMYPSNQVEACGRTFGFSGSNTSGGWAFGLPIPRSWTPTCDLWKAAEEAQQNGHIYTSYMFQCSIKAIRKVWGEEACLEFETRMMYELGFKQEEVTGVWIPNDDYEVMMMAQVSKKEYQDNQEEVEYRQEQQETLIEALQEEHAADEKKIQALKVVVTKALTERDAHLAEEDRKTSAFAEIYAKYEIQEGEQNDEN